MFRYRAALGLLAIGLCAPALNATAKIRITQLVVDGRTQEPARDAKPLQVTATARAVQFHFAEADRDGQPTARLRYKLEGFDETWCDLPVKMRAMLYFQDRERSVVGSSEFYLTGETPGWRGDLATSEYSARREQAVAPARSAFMRVSFLSHGGEAGVGLLGFDAVRLRVEPAAGGQPKVFDLNITKGTELAHPLGSPSNWIREGSRAELAQLLTRPTPAPHPILIIADDDPLFFGNWATQTSIPVAPGDHVTLEWQTAHSIGGSGVGVAEYPRLKTGTYLFRVAAARANGELTGAESALPLVVVAPFYLRWDFWLVLVALLLAASAWIGRVAMQRRMQRRLAELEHQQALEHERARIARDLHDHIGAGLTEIAMQSDWVHNDLAQSPTTDTQQRVARIRQSATELARSVDEIVWAINPANDNLKRFANYLAQYTAQFLEASGLRVRFDIPPDLPPTPLPGKVRHNLFLAVREALNNAAKHAQADLVRVEIHSDADGVQIAIADNGHGFTPDQPGATGTHEGLDNMRRRMEEIGGTFNLTSQPGTGTRVELRSKA